MANVFRTIGRALDGLISASGILAIVMILLLSALVVANALSRHFAEMSILGLFDAAMYSLFIFPFLTAAYTLREGKHISVDVLTTRLPARTRTALGIPIYLASLVFIIILGWQAVKWAYSLFSTKSMTVAVWSIPHGILISIMGFGCVVVILQLIRIITDNIQSLASERVAGASPRLRDNPLFYVSIFIIGSASGVTLFIYGNPIAGAFFLLLFFLFSGMPVFFALGLAGCSCLYFLIGSSALMLVPVTAYKSLLSFPLTCLPLFILGGLIMEKGKIVDNLFRFFALFSGRFATSLLLATILAGLIFCATSGSSVGTTAVVAAAALPILGSRGYRKALSAGVIGGSTVGTMIPPSIGYVIYGVMTGESIAQLFIAAIIPGVIIFGFYFAYIIILGTVSKKSLFEGGQVPSQALQQVSVSWKERLLVTRKAVWGLLTPVIILGGIYTGVFTPTEAAAFLVVYSIVVCAFVTRTLEWRDLLKATLRGAEISSMILCIIFSAYIFALVVSQLQISAGLVALAKTLGLGAYGVLGIIFILLLILGMFLDAASCKVITLPVFYPLAMSVGINSLWLGIFYQILLEIGLLTPPIGLNLFVIKGTAPDIPMATIIEGNIPFILMMVLGIVSMFFFPQIVTWLPSTMYGG